MLPGNIYEEPVELYTDPIQVNVQALPSPAPAGFNGAVGQYDVEATFSPQVAVVSQPSTLFVSVNGVGNIRELPELSWPGLEGWQAYNSLTSMTTAMENGKLTGTRVYERVMVPERIGEFVIPAIPFVYFDPVEGRYKTVETERISVRVIPAPTPDATALAAALPTSTPVGLAQPDIPAASESRIGLLAWFDLFGLGQRVVAPLAVVFLVGVCGLIPAALVLGLGGRWLWRHREQLSDSLKPEPSKPPESLPQPEAFQKPRQSIHPALVAAMKVNNNNYKAVNLAFNTYLGNVLHTSINGLTRTELAARLQKQGLDQGLIDRIERCLAESEMGRYGPVSEDSGWPLMVEADSILFELDKVFDKEA
jgi:hypothetical protein